MLSHYKLYNCLNMLVVVLVGGIFLGSTSTHQWRVGSVVDKTKDGDI